MHNIDIFKNLETAAQAPENPIILFRDWFNVAEKTELSDPNAMALATINPDGKPGVRIVLMKHFDEKGFVFFTNRESRKGMDLNAHPSAGLCFHWKSLSCQVRVEGLSELISDEESDAYFDTRPYGSRIGAWASRQSQILDSRTTLITEVADIKARYPENQPIPRPPHWGGYRVKPEKIEFWHDGDSRLHTRVLYEKSADGWTRRMLYP